MSAAFWRVLKYVHMAGLALRNSAPWCCTCLVYETLSPALLNHYREMRHCMQECSAVYPAVAAQLPTCRKLFAVRLHECQNQQED